MHCPTAHGPAAAGERLGSAVSHSHGQTYMSLFQLCTSHSFYTCTVEYTHAMCRLTFSPRTEGRITSDGSGLLPYTVRKLLSQDTNHTVSDYHGDTVTITVSTLSLRETGRFCCTRELRAWTADLEPTIWLG